MAKITIDIPNELMQRVVEGYAYQNGYQDEIPDVDPATRRDRMKANPETKAQFVRRILQRHIKQAVRAWEVNRAEEAARQAAHKKVDDEINLTVT